MRIAAIACASPAVVGEVGDVLGEGLCGRRDRAAAVPLAPGGESGQGAGVGAAGVRPDAVADPDAGAGTQGELAVAVRVVPHDVLLGGGLHDRGVRGRGDDVLSDPDGYPLVHELVVRHVVVHPVDDLVHRVLRGGGEALDGGLVGMVVVAVLVVGAAGAVTGAAYALTPDNDVLSDKWVDLSWDDVPAAIPLPRVLSDNQGKGVPWPSIGT